MNSDGIGPKTRAFRAGGTQLNPTRRLELLNQVGAAIASSSDLQSILQIVTDVATEITGARFGSFFYNVLDEKGESYLLYTLSGAPRSAFEKFGMPRNTAVFDHTFRGLGVVRSDDIKLDPRYGRLAPHHGMPKGHLPVTSYLAVPVASRTGEILGGLFFGHQEPGVFTEADEYVVMDIAARAAVAIDNSRLLDAAQRLASIVEASDDAIVSKDLEGTIRSWNGGAERVFGYSAKEIVGQPITTLIPEELQHEEGEIIARIMAGERVDHFETIRQRKDGSRFHVLVTISPIRDRSGKIIGASKIARDIDLTKRAQETQALLLREMNHRVKNLFAVASGVVALSARSPRSDQELALVIQSRLAALARAHDLTLLPEGATAASQAHLKELVRTILSPYDTGEGHISIEGPDAVCGSAVSTSFALLLHELATNSIKHGSLSQPTGKVTVAWSLSDRLDLTWTETGGPSVKEPVEQQGFGSVLMKATVKSMNGSIEHSWRPEGVQIRLVVPGSQLAG